MRLAAVTGASTGCIAAKRLYRPPHVPIPRTSAGEPVDAPGALALCVSQRQPTEMEERERTGVGGDDKVFVITRVLDAWFGLRRLQERADTSGVIVVVVLVSLQSTPPAEHACMTVALGVSMEPLTAY